jgi:adenine-specific DNA-methyltransferase
MSVEKLDLTSPDLVNQNIEKLATLFPNCVTESANGKAIDFDLLKQELNHEVVEGNKERYRLEWPGKREAIVTANLPTTKTLRPVREDSVDFDNTENLYIEGDNLEVLKLLQESYLGKVKMIYIDPPYNTGKDFVYKDNFSKETQEELIESGQKDEYNQRLIANPETAGRYHSDWLSMMYPRLKLARNLLSDDGVIFISIDENESSNLRKLGNEIFGEDNFIGEIVWQKRKGGGNDSRHLAVDHEIIMVYVKSIIEQYKVWRVPYDEKYLKRYKEEDDNGKYYWDTLHRGGLQSPIIYDVECPDGSVIENGTWQISKSSFNEKRSKGEVRITKSRSGWSVQHKVYQPKGRVFRSIFTDVSNTDAANEMKLLFQSTKIFDNPKPSDLIIKLIELCDAKNDDVIIDFFSGSATTSHAVMKSNSLDSLKRKFIQIQLPEAADEKSEAFKAGYKNICEIGKERIRRAAKKIKEETGADIDYGFRVYKLDESNMQDVYYKPQEYNQAQLDAFLDNVKPDRTPDDLLAQVMLDWGLPLSLKIEQASINGKQVLKVAENSLFACFDNGIDEDFAKEIAKEAPLRIVFKDSGFKDDTAKTNVKQLLKQLSPETEMKVI